MTTSKKPSLRIGCLLAIILTGSACSRMSDQVQSDFAGMNGGFEHVESGLPVNWLVYSPETIPTGDYELALDPQDFKEGQQSLKFLVHECSPNGGWSSPGITQEYRATPGASYVVSYWIKNRGCDYEVRVGGVAPKTGEMVTIDSMVDSSEAWRHVEHVYEMPDDYDSLRFELSIRSPGSLWIDGVKIERAAG